MSTLSTLNLEDVWDVQLADTRQGKQAAGGKMNKYVENMIIQQ